MPLQHKQFLVRLAQLTDASLLCDILDIDAEDIIERFEDVIEDKLNVLQEVFDIDIDTEEDYYDE